MAEKDETISVEPTPKRAARNDAGTILRKKKIVKVKPSRQNPTGEKETVELYARLRRDGREKKRRIYSEREAPQKWRELEQEFEEDARRREQAKSSSGKTFKDLIDYFEKNHLKEAVWRDGQVVSGYRSPLAVIRTELRASSEFFGSLPLCEITYDLVEAFKQKRLSRPVVIRYTEKVPIDKTKRPPESRKQFERVSRTRTKERKIATVNRELSRLRLLFNHAVRLEWLDTNPFQRGQPLIQLSAENERTRILSPAEEEALISACTGARAHLRPIVVFALETAMRKGEILKLAWRDVDFEQNIIWAEGKNTKTLRPRIVPMTTRLKLELLDLKRSAGKNPASCVFQIKSFKRSFATACRLAGIRNFRFHDLRHTATTRIAAVVSETTKAMRITGHTQIKTFLRYNNVDAEIAREVGALLDSRRADEQAAPSAAPNVARLEDFKKKKTANG